MDKIDIIIPLHDVSRVNYIDLIFTLRSIEKNLSNYRNIYIIGNVPVFIKNTINIKFNQSKSDDDKQKNILNKILFCIDTLDLTDRFLFFNDDHVLMKSFNALEFPNYCGGELKQINTDNNYRITVNNTIRFLQSKGFNINNFDIHTPIIYDKVIFKSVFKSINFPRFGYCIKSIYGNLSEIEPTYLDDFKITSKISYLDAKDICNDKPIVSFGDAAIKTGLKEYLTELLPNKSIYEK